MTTWIALLRGINVGGHRRLPMADLRASLAGAGFAEVRTYIQSGNVVLESAQTDADADADAVAEGVRTVVERDFGYNDVPIVVRSAEQWRTIMAANPFPDAEATPKQLFVYFCHRPPTDYAVGGFDHDRYAPDRLGPADGEIFVAYAEGMSKSKLDSAAVERSLGVTATARNWSTVTKLADLSGETS